MWTFIARRVLATIPLLILVSFLTYCLLWAAPGDYYTKMQDDPRQNPQKLADLRHRAGLDRGLLGGYAFWAKNVIFHGDFGHSLAKDKAVFELLGERVLNTMILALSALAFAWIVAIPLGVLSAVRPNSTADKLCGLISYFGLSIPSVFFALLMMLLAARTGWFPVGDMRDLVNWDDLGSIEKIKDVVYHLVLPTFVLGTTSMAGWMRQLRGSMVETLSQDYIRTARAKGLAEHIVLYKHALRNAVNPLVTLFGYSIAHILSGSFLVEVVVSWPGMARLTVEALFSQDQPLVMAAILVETVLLVFGNLVADVLLAWVDPRIRLS